MILYLQRSLIFAQLQPFDLVALDTYFTGALRTAE